jgi:hypothetical protein
MRAFALLPLLCLFAAPARAELVDVQFGATWPTASTPYTGAAVIGGSGDQWNFQQSKNGTNVALTDTSGAATGISMSFQAQGTYGVGGGSAFNGTDYYELMQGFLYTQGGPIDVTFSGLTAGESYELLVYGQSDGNSPAYGGTITANGSSATALQNTYSIFVAGGNYVQLTGTADSNGDIVITDAKATDRDQTMINGIQLVVDPIPEPATLLLAPLLAAPILLRRRRRS